MATQRRDYGKNEALPALHGDVHHLAQRLRVVQIRIAWDDDFLCTYRQRPCLLYTSPSPRDLSTSRMPSSA